MPEIWAYCAYCRKWFDCPQWFEPRAPEQNCPRCSGEPTAIINRAATVLREPDL